MIRFFYLVRDIILRKPSIEILHLIVKFLDIIDHYESITSHEWEREEEVVEIFPLHRIDIDEVKIFLSQGWEDFFRISPDRVDIFHLAVREVLDGFDMSIPGVLDGGYLTPTLS
jgi:hypothetical protein